MLASSSSTSMMSGTTALFVALLRVLAATAAATPAPTPIPGNGPAVAPVTAASYSDLARDGRSGYVGLVAGSGLSGKTGEDGDGVFAFMNQEERRFVVDELESGSEGLMTRTHGRSSRPRRNQISRRMLRRAAEGDDDEFEKAVAADIGVDASVVDDTGGIHLPLVRTVRRRDSEGGTKRRRKRNEVTGAIGLGTAQDVTYNVLVTIGNTTTPLVLDTGSSDLWVISSACTSCFSHITDNRTHPPLYPSPPPSTFHSFNLTTSLHYGDTLTGTYASGLLGSERVGLAGLALDGQCFVSVGETNASVVDTGSGGILGMGFPVNSVIWNKLYSTHLNETSPSATESNSTTTRRSVDDIPPHRRLPTLPNYASNAFGLNSKFASNSSNTGAKAVNASSSPIPVLESFSLFGSFIARFVLPPSPSSASSHSSPASRPQPHPHLPSPLISITLQRTTPSSAFSNTGLLSIGSLPPGIEPSKLAWAPVRLYDHEKQGGLRAPEAPEERYPFAWEVGVEGVWFDGVGLGQTRLGDVAEVGVGVSALVDTGSSLIRGPADIVRNIISLLAAAHPSANANAGSDPSSQDEDRASALLASSDTRAAQSRGLYPCSVAHTLTFQIGGRNFSVDPRDFGTQAYVDDVEWCVPNLVVTDAPRVGGYLYSWSLGDPFLKGVLAAFYYGNITHPSVDPPKIGLLSTVPDNAAELLAEAVQEARNRAGGSNPGSPESGNDGRDGGEGNSDGDENSNSNSGDDDGDGDGGKANFPVTTIPAPTGTWVPFTTNSDGVGMFGAAGETGVPGVGGVGGRGGVNSGRRVGGGGREVVWAVAVGVVGVVWVVGW